MAYREQTCVSRPTAALISVDNVGTCRTIKTRIGNTFVHFRLAQQTRISGGACAQVTYGGDRQRVTGGGVLARCRQAAVHLTGAPTSGIARRACAPEGVDEVDARAAVSARRGLALVDIRLTITTNESRHALTEV